MTNDKRSIVIISDTIRRDLQAPLRRFNHFRIIHFYRNASYGDMRKEDFEHPQAVQFRGPVDLFRKIARYKPDIIQVPEPSANQTSFMAGIMVVTYKMTHNVALIMPCFENRPFKNKFGKGKYYLVIGLTKLLGLLSKRIFVLNQGAKDNLLHLGIPEKKMVHLMWGSWGINMSEFKPMERKKKYDILFIGRVSRAKGIVDLIQAYTLVKKQFPNCKLAVAGPKDDAFDEIEKNKIRYLGTIKNDDVAALINEARILVMPSRTTQEWEEQVGMVGLQAMACGVPVVTTKSGAIPEYFTNETGALLVEENNPGQLASAIIRLISDELYLDKQSKQAHTHIKRNFEVGQSIRDIENELLLAIEA